MKHWLRSIILAGSITCTLSRTVAAAEPANFHNALSLQGFTGILNTPSAHVTKEGWLDAHYANQEEGKWRHTTPFQDDYQFSLGMFNFIEIGGRFFEAPRAGRDLSANFKITSAPLTQNYPLLPVIAVGMQDIGGGAALLQTKYVAVSEDIWRLRLSAGYGQGPDRMKGLFGGAEFKAHDWIYLLGEYDTKETNLGARVVLPQFWKVPVRFTATVKTSLDYKPGNFDLAFGFSLPLDFKVRGEERGTPGTLRAEQSLNAEDRTPSLEQSSVLSIEPSIKAEPSILNSEPYLTLRDSLVAEGFLNVRVGTTDRTLVVEYENTVFNHNELDALGLVTGLACQAATAHIDTLRVVIKRRNIRMATVTAPLNSLRAFLERPEGLRDLRDNLQVDFDTDETGKVDFAGGDDNSGILNTSLILAPGLTTFIGTEVGAFDYLVSLKPELNTMLWKGAAVVARWDLPISWSENLEDGKQYRSSRNGSRLDRLMLFQAVKPLPSVMLNLGAGLVVADRYGMLNEALWSPGGGEHRFRVTQGFDRNETTRRQSDLLLGSYRYYYSPLDLSLEAAAGKFWAEDKGVSLELKRFWDDTAVSFFYKNTKGTDQKRWQAVGIQFSVPLTPRRDMKPLAKIQVRGSDEWSYAQQTTLKNTNLDNSQGNLNWLAPYPLAVNPQPAQALYRSFYNRDRMSEGYIRQHLDRLREAWLKYGALQNQ